MSTLTLDYRAPLSPSRRAPSAAIAASHSFGQASTRWRMLPVVAAIAALHIAAVGVFSRGSASRSLPPQAKPVTIDIVPIREEVPPPPPKPVTPLVAATPAAPSHNLPVVSEPSASSASADAVQVASAPSIPSPAPPPPAPVVEKVTEPRGYAGYLENPAPEYPLAAQKRGLEGQVLLKVHVLATGQPDQVAVAKSSGHAILDDSAVKAVLQWVFEPAKRGQNPIDGWVQVPLNFKI